MISPLPATSSLSTSADNAGNPGDAPSQHIHALIEALGFEWPKRKAAEIARNVRERHHFSPLRAITIKETDHSRILGDLLDPDGTHGEGPRFLHEFLRVIGMDQPEEGTWQVKVESDNVDILLVRLD